MPSDFRLLEALKGQQWEIAKGHLQAMVALESSRNEGPSSEDAPRWQRLSELVEEFIASVEDEGLHE